MRRRQNISTVTKGLGQDAVTVPSRVFGVDWSGDKRNARRKIWIAEVSGDRVVRLENGRRGDEITNFFQSEARRDKNFVVGFDFAFSFPITYCQSLKAGDAYHVWKTVAAEGEEWLSRCNTPFWGKPGRKRQEGVVPFRRTELTITSKTGATPKSVFQIGGAGAVGTGSVRGMPILKRLYDSGFSIWPFTDAACPLVVEIYPRLLTGPVNKSSPICREEYLARLQFNLPKPFYDCACSNEDAFDAAVSALVMSTRVKEFVGLQQSTESVELMEGKIWY